MEGAANPEMRAFLEQQWRRGVECLRHYPRDGASDAERAAKAGDRRFIRLSHSGVAAYDIVEGLPLCPLDDQHSKAIDQWDSVIGDDGSFDANQRCDELVRAYATAFNRRMADLEPGLLQSCGTEK